MLYSPAAGREDNPSKAQGCRFRALFSTLDEVGIVVRQNVSGFFQNLRKSAGAAAMDVPGVGDQAYTRMTAGNVLTLQFLKGDTWVTLDLRLQPSSMMEDLPYLAELGRAIARRLD